MNIQVQSWWILWYAGVVFGIGAMMGMCSLVTIVNIYEWICKAHKLMKKNK